MYNSNEFKFKDKTGLFPCSAVSYLRSCRIGLPIVHKPVFVITALIVLETFAKTVQGSPVLIQPRSTVECIPATWQDVLIFVLVNYITHAMTVNSLPGESVAASVIYNLVALVFPFTGAWRGIRAVKSAAIFGEDRLQQAARAGALCIVARSMHWQPIGEEKIHGCTLQGPVGMEFSEPAVLVVREYQGSTVDLIRPRDVRIHGQCSLPQGYYLIRLPENVMVSTDGHDPLDIACFHPTTKVILSLMQLGFACVTLYRARGSQLQQYGYAAFSLTVMPYAIMSFINLIGNLITPTYSTVFMVRSEVMDEAEARGGIFHGTIGSVPTHSDNDNGEESGGIHTVSFGRSGQCSSDIVCCKGLESRNSGFDDRCPTVQIVVASVGRYVTRLRSSSEKRMTALAYVLGVLGLLLPYVMISVLTGFDPRNSTHYQRLWTMSWLVVGQVVGIVVAFAMKGIHDCGGRVILLFPSAILVIPAIGGLVTVAKMIKEFGQCLQL